MPSWTCFKGEGVRQNQLLQSLDCLLSSTVYSWWRKINSIHNIWHLAVIYVWKPLITRFLSLLLPRRLVTDASRDEFSCMFLSSFLRIFLLLILLLRVIHSQNDRLFMLSWYFFVQRMFVSLFEFCSYFINCLTSLSRSPPSTSFILIFAWYLKRVEKESKLFQTHLLFFSFGSCLLLQIHLHRKFHVYFKKKASRFVFALISCCLFSRTRQLFFYFYSHSENYCLIWCFLKTQS